MPNSNPPSNGQGTLVPPSGSNNTGQVDNNCEDDDFEVINSVYPDLSIYPPPDASIGIQLLDLNFPATAPSSDTTTVMNASHNGCSGDTLKENGSSKESNKESDGSITKRDETPILETSIMLDGKSTSGSVQAPGNTLTLDMSCMMPSINEPLTMNTTCTSCDVDPVMAIESIRSEYTAAQETLHQENELLRKACEAKDIEISNLKRRLDDASSEKLRMDGEMNKREQFLKELSLQFDELIAQKMQCDDIIKLQEANIKQLKNDGSGTTYSPRVTNEPGLLSLLQSKDRQIADMTVQLQRLHKEYSDERGKVLDLEEIVKVLHEQNGESEEMLRNAQQQYRSRINELQEEIQRYAERGEVSHVGGFGHR